MAAAGNSSVSINVVRIVGASNTNFCHKTARTKITVFLLQSTTEGPRLTLLEEILENHIHLCELEEMLCFSN